MPKLHLIILIIVLLCACDDSQQATSAPAPTGVPDQKAVLVRTDKAEYEQGEVVKLWVKNNLDAPLWYAREAECVISSFWFARDCETPAPDSWDTRCIWETPQHDFTRLDPDQVLQDDEAPETLEGEWYALELSEPGCYTIVFPYSLVEKQAIGAEWGVGRLEALSDEFSIKP